MFGFRDHGSGFRVQGLPVEEEEQDGRDGVGEVARQLQTRRTANLQEDRDCQQEDTLGAYPSLRCGRSLHRGGHDQLPPCPHHPPRQSTLCSASAPAPSRPKTRPHSAPQPHGKAGGRRHSRRGISTRLNGPEEHARRKCSCGWCVKEHEAYCREQEGPRLHGARRAQIRLLE